MEPIETQVKQITK